MHSRRSRTRAFPVLMILTPIQLPFFIIIPPVTDVHVMLKKIECERIIWSTKRCQGKTERQRIKNVRRPDC